MLHRLEKSTDWKAKYQGALDDLEARRQEWARLEELLRRTIGRLAIAGRGFDTRLDKVLREIQEISREKRDRQLSAALERLTAAVDALEGTGPDTRQRRADPVVLMLELLQNIHFDANQRVQLKEICSELLLSVANGRDRDSIRGYIQKLAALINENFDDLEADSRAAQIFVRLIDLLALDRETAASLHAQLRDIRKIQQQELRSLADTLNQRLGAAGSDQSIDTVMTTLLDRLSIITGESNANQEVQARIAEGIEPEDWPSALNPIVNSVVASLKRLETEKRELERFIIGVTEQLGEITEVISADRDDNRSTDADARSLHQLVTDGIALMQKKSDSASNLSELKVTIGNNIDAIRGGVDDFVERIHQRHRESEQRNEKLSAQLSQMEQETQELQVMLNENRAKLMHDTLTGVYSRMAYDERICEELSRWSRYRASFAYVILDIDHFKRINDTYGHSAGDRALKIIAQMMQQYVRQSDYVFRIGGEEFVILLPSTDEGKAAEVIEKLRHGIAESRFHFRGDPVQLTVSAGITETRVDDRAETIYERADAALYQAKGAGRNCQVIAP